MAFRSRRQARYTSLLNAGFLRFEALELSRVTFAEAPYLRRMMVDRRNMQRAFINQATAMRWSQSKTLDEWRQVIRSEYLDRGWVQEKTKRTTFQTAYKASPWAMLRDYRDKAIDAGEYFPKERRGSKGSHHKRVVTLSDIQRARAGRRLSKERERQRRLADPEAMERYRQQRHQQKLRARQREIRG